MFLSQTMHTTMRSFFILLLFLLLGNINISAQIKSYSQDPEVFVKEFQQYVATQKDPNLDKLVVQFREYWDQGKLSDAEKLNIRNICESMLFKKLSIDPHYEWFLSGLNYFFSNNLNKEILDQWSKIGFKLMEKNVKEYAAFLKTAKLLFSENILYQSEAITWRADNNLFELVFDGRLAIKFKTLTLTGSAFLDKTIIYETSGVFYPDKAQWVGNKGKINWERVELTEDEVHCLLSKYNINFSSSEFIADSVFLRYPKYFKGDVMGQLREKVSFITNTELLKNASFPAFTSYRSDVKIDGIVGVNATYSGGFSLDGRIINGANLNKEPVTITLLHNKKPIIELKSESFKIDNGIVGSLKSSMTILIDSVKNIYHPSVIVRYDIVKGELTVTKGEEGLMLMPFQDDFHEVEIDVDRIKWKQSTPYIEFDMISPDKAAKIDSRDFYREYTYEKMQGMLSFNPIYRMRDYAMKTRQNKFSIHDYAAFYKTEKRYLNEQIINLADQAFLYYNNKTDTIEIRPKLFNYVNNHMKVRDYDVIQMTSVIEALPNITMSLNNMNLQVEGVRNFTISDSQNCMAVPHEQRIVIKKNRDMRFGGMVRAGKVDFYSKDFNMEYAPFMVRDTYFDSMVLYYPDEMTGSMRKIQSVLTDLFGTLEFDYPKNKSGLKKKEYPDYPIFTSLKGSKVHYEYAQTHNFIYKKESFYFEVDPFRITNLNNFTAADLSLKGTFISDDIFPNFKHEISIQPDFSLGFVTTVDKPMYKGKGQGQMTLSLSNKGLYGNGNINYLGSVTKSDGFLMFPRETISNAESFDLAETTKYPLVKGLDVKNRWLPYSDQMLVTNQESKFEMFKMQYAFDGTLELSPKALSGNGQLEWSEAEFYSKNMVYGRNRVDADTSGIRIFSVNPEVFAFQTDNVQSKIDFDKREGKFTANSIESLTYLPQNKYATLLSDVTWKMDPKKMELRPNPKFPSVKPYFLSVHKDQDSLKFESLYADFDMNESVIKIQKIPFIDVADSRIFPNKGLATVRINADMDRLDSSKIEANRTDKFHSIVNCKTKVYGKNNIRASGEYTYVTKMQEKYTIHMDSIKINRDLNLEGVGYIPDTQSFYLDKHIAYKGWTKIRSIEKPIDYFGFVKPDHNLDFIAGQWLRFKGPMDAQNVVIDVKDPRNVDNRKLMTGLFVATDSARIYPLLFGMKRNYSEAEITLDSGVLFYDHANNSIVIGEPKKLFEKEEKGNVFSINTKTNTLKTEGAYSLELNVKDGFKAGFGGESTWKPGDTTFSFDWSFYMDYSLPKEAVARFVELAKSEDYGKQTSIQTSTFAKNATEFYPSLTDAKSTIDRIKNNGAMSPENTVATTGFFQKIEEASDKVQEIFDPNLYIKDVMSRAPEKAQIVVAKSNWSFDNRTSSFISRGEMDFASLNGVNINKKFNAMIVVDKKRSGDDVHIYIELSSSQYFYFNYVRGVMYAISTDDKFNQAILEKGEKISNDEYSLRLGTLRSVDRFLRRFD